MNIHKQTHDIAERLAISWDDANTLRRAARTLHTWNEKECGDSNDFMSWSIERDETTNKPYFCRYPHTGKSSRYLIADRETGALKRIAAICARCGLHYFHQTDPRGASLHLGREPMTDSNYSSKSLATA